MRTAPVHNWAFTKAIFNLFYLIVVALSGGEGATKKGKSSRFTPVAAAKITGAEKANYQVSIKKQKTGSKGDLFEQYIVAKFDPNYFKIKEWRSDQYIERVYAVSNRHPDFKIEYNYKPAVAPFAVERTYRSAFDGGYIEWAKPYQLDNDRKFSYTLNIPVFVATGLGGDLKNPEEEFIIPLNHVSNTATPYNEPKPKERGHREKLFYKNQDQILIKKGSFGEEYLF